MATHGTSASAGSGQTGSRPRVLVLVENLSVPFDRRVWQECRALTEAGYQVEVICPRGATRAKGDPAGQPAVIDRLAGSAPSRKSRAQTSSVSTLHSSLPKS
jgi:hypothetical protein